MFKRVLMIVVALTLPIAVPPTTRPVTLVIGLAGVTESTLVQSVAFA